MPRGDTEQHSLRHMSTHVTGECDILVDMNQAINLHQFQDEFFAGVVARCVEECANYYENRLAAIYVWGSVQRQEAVRGVSDLDLIVFVKEASEADRKWRNNQINDQVETEFPDFAWGLIPHPTDITEAPHNTIPTDTEHQQMRNRGFAYLLLHNATLVFGEEVTKELTLPPPDKPLARWALPLDPLRLARFAAGLETQNRSDFELPGEPSLKLRKLARLSVLGGAYLLMAQGHYKSDKGTDVFPLLARNEEWSNFLDYTRRVYITPTATTSAEVDEYATKLVAWLEWVQKQLD